MAKLPGPTKEWLLKVEIVDMETGVITREQKRFEKSLATKAKISPVSFLNEQLIGMGAGVSRTATETPIPPPKKKDENFMDEGEST